MCVVLHPSSLFFLFSSFRSFKSYPSDVVSAYSPILHNSTEVNKQNKIAHFRGKKCLFKNLCSLRLSGCHGVFTPTTCTLHYKGILHSCARNAHPHSATKTNTENSWGHLLLHAAKIENKQKSGHKMRTRPNMRHRMWL